MRHPGILQLIFLFLGSSTVLPAWGADGGQACNAVLWSRETPGRVLRQVNHPELHAVSYEKCQASPAAGGIEIRNCEPVSRGHSTVSYSELHDDWAYFANKAGWEGLKQGALFFIPWKGFLTILGGVKYAQWVARGAARVPNAVRIMPAVVNFAEGSAIVGRDQFLRYFPAYIGAVGIDTAFRVRFLAEQALKGMIEDVVEPLKLASYARVVGPATITRCGLMQVGGPLERYEDRLREALGAPDRRAEEQAQADRERKEWPGGYDYAKTGIAAPGYEPRVPSAPPKAWIGQ